MRVLITGGSGLLGKSLLETMPPEHEVALTYNKNWPTVSANWYNLDIKSRSDVFELFDIFKPNFVIHCASIGSVDYTEDHYQAVRKVNVTGLGNVIDACNGYKAKIAYVSTNAVYSGENPPYNETSPLEPVNSYGVIKREAERLVEDRAKRWLIFRPFMLYGWPFLGARNNWVIAILDKLQKNQVVKLVNDVVWMPTYAPDCADAIWKLLFQFDKEIYNVASPDRVTLYEFGLYVCDVFDLDKDLLQPILTEDLWNIAKRPKDTTYDLLKLAQIGFMLSDVKSGLIKMRETK